MKMDEEMCMKMRVLRDADLRTVERDAKLDALVKIITHLYRRAEKAETRLHKARLELRRLRSDNRSGETLM